LISALPFIHIASSISRGTNEVANAKTKKKKKKKKKKKSQRKNK